MSAYVYLDLPYDRLAKFGTAKGFTEPLCAVGDRLNQSTLEYVITIGVICQHQYCLK